MGASGISSSALSCWRSWSKRSRSSRRAKSSVLSGDKSRILDGSSGDFIGKSSRGEVLLQKRRGAGGFRGARAGRLLPHPDRLVKGIALDRNPAGFADGFEHGGFALRLRCLGTGHVKDVFF